MTLEGEPAPPGGKETRGQGSQGAGASALTGSGALYFFREASREVPATPQSTPKRGLPGGKLY